MRNAKKELLLKVLHLEKCGFTGLFTGRVHRKRDAARLVEEGLLYEKSLVVCDGDGFTKEPERWRTGYVLTTHGRTQAEEENRDA